MESADRNVINLGGLGGRVLLGLKLKE
jgi:hypothetical protein